MSSTVTAIDVGVDDISDPQERNTPASRKKVPHARCGIFSRRCTNADAGRTELVKEEEESLTVEESLEKALEALQEADEAVEKVDTLPSAYPEPRITRVFRKLPRILLVAQLLAFMVSHYYGGIVQCIGGAIGALAISALAYKKGSLSKSGAWAAWFIGFGTMASSLRCGVILLAFFFSSSRLTKWKEDVKSRFDAEFKPGGQRDWKQVFSNGLIPMVLAVSYGFTGGFSDFPMNSGWSRTGTFVLGAFLGYYSCCCGDTWASEVGVLSKDTPRLITSGRPVRKGTNGGVTILGLLASLAGGLFIGAMMLLTGCITSIIWMPPQTTPYQWPLLGLGLAGGVIGSIIDSILGATIQYSGFDIKTQKVVNKPGDPEKVFQIAGRDILNNNQVNICSASLTALLIGWLALKTF